ncbi:MAG TPA: ECF-type sigma factor, partial [Verrucomicrobiae bacterium]|nr:ECF-type sigma factor [Verrucomicrobiae bacterium]
QACRHGGDQQRLDVDEVKIAAPMQEDELLAVNEALDRFSQHAPQKAELVKLRYFVGMTNEEAADVLGISPRSAKYYWTHARAWLFREVRSQMCPRACD